MTFDQDLTRQLTRWADDLAEQIPAYRLRDTFSGADPAPRPRWRRSIVAAALVVLTIVAGLWLRQEQESSLSTGVIEVYYERVEVAVTAEYECTEPKQGAPDRAVVETWEDLANKRYRRSVVYSDGTVVDTISIGGPYYPSAEYVRGNAPETAFGCGDPPVTLGVVGGGALNVRTERPLHANGDPLVLRPRDTAKPVDGEFTDSRGRPAKLLQEVVTGFGDGFRPLRQTTSVYVDPVTDDVVETVYVNQISTLGTVTTRSTLVEQGSRLVSPALFDHAGYESIAVRPNPTDSRPPATRPNPGGTTR